MEVNNFFSIAIDGPAGSGKSTIAKSFAEKCKDFTYINTGSMFRAIAYYCMNNNVDIENDQELEHKINNINIELEHNFVFINDGKQKEEVSAFLRTQEIDILTTKISKIKIVRDKLLKDQIILSQKSNVIMDGRDIGTVVLPNASLKFFLTASVDVRAQRRYEQVKNDTNEITLDKIKSEIEKRDIEDSTRSISPLVQPKDAILIDSTTHTIDEILFIIEKEYALKNKKNLVGKLNKINKTVNKLMIDFIDIYNDINIRKNLISYDEIIDFDYKVYEIHSLFIKYLENFLFLKDKLNPKIIQLYLDVFEEIKLPIDDYVKSEKFDLLYYSYLLVKIYILIPYIYESIGYFIYKLNLDKLEERHKYLIKTRFLSRFINLNCSTFKKIDDLDLKVANLVEDNNEKHEQMQFTYANSHKKFNKIFNQFILVQSYEIKEANKVFKLSFLYKNWYYFLGTLILLIIILLVIIILTTK